MTNAGGEYRFEIALSFPGEYRKRVEKIAELLAARLGRDKVLYDKWYRFKNARPRLNVHLPKQYQQSRLLVFFLCGEFVQKSWCGLEWRVALDLIQREEDERVMLLRFDNADVPGLYLGDGDVNIAEMPDEEVAAGIFDRLGLPVLPVIDQAIASLRDRIRPGILDRCGTIRILNMEQPIELGGVYAAVHILEKRPANTRKSLEQLIRETRLDTLGRFGISASAVKRVSGETAFLDNRRVILYGKPGAGKTTFLKYLAVECIHGNFRPTLAPAFVPLKAFAEADGSPTLTQHIEKEWGDLNSRMVLESGRGLVLLDGLDEVRDRDFDRVRKEIEGFTTDFPTCTIAVTCRIAAREYCFERFAEVEMADFDLGQIETFATGWFRLRGEGNTAAGFMEKLRANQPVRELATSPLLLTLLCLIFEELNDFGDTRAKLYGEGLDILLRKWDAKRKIERDLPYKLSVTDLESLLLQVAYDRFLAGEYFFEQDSLVEEIGGFFADRNLVASGSEHVPERVLTSIESHLGLLVQRAVGVYSFSHLTFQEYLTALRVKNKPTLMGEIGRLVGEPRWREVWMLLASMLDPEYVIPALKIRVDLLVRHESAIQQVLQWCCRKATAQSGGYKPAALRAFFFALDLGLGRALDRDRALDLGLGRALDLALALDLDLDLGRALDLGLDLGLDLDLARTLDRDRDSLGSLLDRVAREAQAVAPGLVRELKTLRAELKSLKKAEFPPWRGRLRDAAIRHRDIGHDWQLTRGQIQLAQQYYQANLLLVRCMDAARGLTNKTRKVIEDSMLLPWDMLHHQ